MLDLHRNRWPGFRLRNPWASSVSSGSPDNEYLHLGQCVPPLLISTLCFLPACNQSSLKRNRSILLGMQTETRTLVISKSYPLRTDSAFISRYLGIEIAWFFNSEPIRCTCAHTLETFVRLVANSLYFCEVNFFDWWWEVLVRCGWLTCDLTMQDIVCPVEKFV